jgi:hypothetical protein
LVTGCFRCIIAAPDAAAIIRLGSSVVIRICRKTESRSPFIFFDAFQLPHCISNIRKEQTSSSRLSNLVAPLTLRQRWRGSSVALRRRFSSGLPFNFLVHRFWLAPTLSSYQNENCLETVVGRTKLLPACGARRFASAF